MRYFGPFPIIERIGSVAYKLALPAHTKIHPIFHVSLLKPFVGSEVPTPVVPLTPLSVPEGPIATPIKFLNSSRMIQDGDQWVKQLLVQWDGTTDTSAETIASLYPTLDLEDKISFDGWGNVTNEEMSLNIEGLATTSLDRKAVHDAHGPISSLTPI